MSTTLGSMSSRRPPQSVSGVDTEAVWTGAVPTIGAARTTVRGLLPSDAESLYSLLTSEPVGQFTLPPPHSIEDFARFIEWTRQQQEAGRQLSFAIVPPGYDHAVGVIQVRRDETDESTAELVLTFLFETAGRRQCN